MAKHFKLLDIVMTHDCHVAVFTIDIFLTEAVDEAVELQQAVDVMDLFNQYEVRDISLSATRRFTQ